MGQVIELVLRAEVGLPCAVVRHLAQVEEKVVESLAWASGSLLWEDIQANEGHLPTCQQVCTNAPGLQSVTVPESFEVRNMIRMFLYTDRIVKKINTVEFVFHAGDAFFTA